MQNAPVHLHKAGVMRPDWAGTACQIYEHTSCCAIRACQHGHVVIVMQKPKPNGSMLVCRAYQERGVVDGWGLLHSLLADVIDDVLGTARKDAVSAAAAEHDAWTLIASLAAEPARENCMGA